MGGLERVERSLETEYAEHASVGDSVAGRSYIEQPGATQARYADAWHLLDGVFVEQS